MTPDLESLEQQRQELEKRLAESTEIIWRLTAEMNGEPQAPPTPTISPVSFAEYMAEASKRRRAPFRPNSWYNADGDCIHVWFENESSYVTKLEGADYSDFEVMRSQHDDRIVGVEVYGIFSKHLPRAVRVLLDRVADLRRQVKECQSRRAQEPAHQPVDSSRFDSKELAALIADDIFKMHDGGRADRIALMDISKRDQGGYGYPSFIARVCGIIDRYDSDCQPTAAHPQPIDAERVAEARDE